MTATSRPEYRARVQQVRGTFVLEIREIADYGRTERDVLRTDLETGRWAEINTLVKAAGFAVTGKGWRHMSGGNYLVTMLGKIPA
ncbi:MAG TPA: hypothetical protein VK547_09740 [Candidatus Udaeobacter sp.]|nr:hypothetical protein [Candidatus Udaeobacter sp.]